MTQTCTSCDSRRVLRGARVVPRGLFGGPLILAVVVESGVAESGVSAEVCVDCGQIALRAADLAKLRSLYAAVGEPLGLNRET